MTDLIICLIVIFTAGGTIAVSEVRLYLQRRPEPARISAEYRYALTEAKIERKALALRSHLTPEDTAFLTANAWDPPPDVKPLPRAKLSHPEPLEGEIVNFYTPVNPKPARILNYDPRSGRTYP